MYQSNIKNPDGAAWPKDFLCLSQFAEWDAERMASAMKSLGFTDTVPAFAGDVSQEVTTRTGVTYTVGIAALDVVTEGNSEYPIVRQEYTKTANGFALVKTHDDKPAPAPDYMDGIRAEAGRRIEATFPIYKQMNALARSAELLEKGKTNWTAAETAEAATLQAIRDWIRSVREASNTIATENADFAEDANWPADFGA